tara:strand:+ start:7916 stop:8740 length:825 start_codon:yes stop_codon:yes gene_type:complete
MPELAELYLITTFLNDNYKNKNLVSFKFNEISKFNKKPPQFLEQFQKDINLKLTDIKRKGKILILVFHDKWWICIHFGLHGFLRTNKKDNIILNNYDNNKKNIHGIFNFENDVSLNFVDISGFGTSFNFFNNKSEFEKYLDKYAIDIKDTKFTFQKFKENIKKIQDKKLKRDELCVVLLKQNYLCSGIGNYMKCEILYQSKLSPYRSINDIDDIMINDLYKSILKITEINIKANGKVSKEFYVFMKNKDKNGNNVIKEKTPDGRSTFWVREVQI